MLSKRVFVIRFIGAVVLIWFLTDFGYLLQSLQSSEVIEKDPNVKYVLQWTSPQVSPFNYMGKGNETFLRRNCPMKNCHVTSNARLLSGSVTAFDAILFHAREITEEFPSEYFPQARSPQQSYIFTSMESSHYYYIQDSRYNGVFNFTWTYKINSDINFGYMVIADREGRVIGPNVTVPWMNVEDMSPINYTIRSKLANKSIAAAWFVSNCHSLSSRERVAADIIAELKKYNMSVDVFGRCGNKQCPRDSAEECLHMLQRHYYFYFAFENSFSEDYVTEKLLNALQNYVVPIVYGGADYKRFMPDGIYLNARELTVAELVRQMVVSIREPRLYEQYFKWHLHYRYRSPEHAPHTDPYCRLCSFINHVDTNRVSTVDNLYAWWNPAPDIMKTMLQRSWWE